MRPAALPFPERTRKRPYSPHKGPIWVFSSSGSELRRGPGRAEGPVMPFQLQAATKAAFSSLQAQGAGPSDTQESHRPLPAGVLSREKDETLRVIAAARGHPPRGQ